MDLKLKVRSSFDETIDTINNSYNLLVGQLLHATTLVHDRIKQGSKVLLCGNGGSAGDAQHLASELINRFEIDRGALAAVSIVSDINVLTAISNDYGYQYIFARQIEALGKNDDILISFSTSGNSENVINGIRAAQKIGMNVIAFGGRGGGQVSKLLREADISLCVPSESTARIQEIHLLLIHNMCMSIDSMLYNKLYTGSISGP